MNRRNCLSRPFVSRAGSAAIQSVLIIAVALVILLALKRFWLGDDGSGGVQKAIERNVVNVVTGNDSQSTPDSTGQPNGGSGNGDEENSNGGDGANGGDGSTSNPSSTHELSEADRKRIAELKALARKLNGLANLAELSGNEAEAAALQAASDAALLEIAHIHGPEALKKEILAIAAERSVEATATALLKAIEKRVPIAHFVTLPIVDGLGQLTGDFVRWWQSNQ